MLVDLLIHIEGVLLLEVSQPLIELLISMQAEFFISQAFRRELIDMATIFIFQI